MQRNHQTGSRARTTVVFAVGCSKDFFKPFLIQLAAKSDEWMVHVDDANEFDFEQIALRIVEKFVRFHVDDFRKVLTTNRSFPCMFLASISSDPLWYHCSMYLLQRRLIYFSSRFL